MGQRERQQRRVTVKTKHTVNLTLDIGNSSVKCTAFDVAGSVVERWREKSVDAVVEKAFEKHHYYEGIIISASGRLTKEDCAKMAERCGKLMVLDSRTPLPIVNDYRSPATLGTDRLAAAVGAATLLEGRNVLIVDLGTAITFDVLDSEGHYRGGNIAAGLRTRIEALHHSTDKLPEVEPQWGDQWRGTTTTEAIGGGALWGIGFEIEGYMAKMREEFGEFDTILTGGDARYFEKRINNTIFADFDLTAIGLNRILNYNATKTESL